MTTARASQQNAALLDCILAASGSMHAGGQAFEARRSAARELLVRSGLPSVRDEAWRFTPVRKLTDASYAMATASEPSAAPTFGKIRGSVEVVLANGRPHLPKAPDGLELLSMHELLRDAPQRLEPYLATASEGHPGFVAANTAAFTDGLCVFVRRGTRVETPLVLAVVAEAAEAKSISFPRVLIVAEAESELVLMEEHYSRGGEQISNMVSEILLAPGAKLEHVRLLGETQKLASLAHTFVRSSRDSRYVARSFMFGGALSRLDLDVCLQGPGAEAILDGLYQGTGDEHVEHHVIVDHRASHCTSNQKFKGVLGGSSRGVFDGTILVAHGTQATVAHQENRNILLSNDAAVHTKPHLQIDADDVKCSHGATVGRLDLEQLFYLRSRGISAQDAHAVLTLAFAKEMTDRVPHAALQQTLAHALLARQPSTSLLEELL